KTILCEKPLAVDAEGAERIVVASRASGVPVIVGTMHAYDPAWAAAAAQWEGIVRLVRAVIVLPPSERFSDVATELHSGPAPLPRPDDPEPPEVLAATMSADILGVATHNLPLVRRFAPVVEEVEAARPLRPFGYDITYRRG